MNPDAVRSQLSAVVRKERHPESHSVFWHSQRRRSFVLAPYRNRRTKKRAVNLLIVAPGDFPAQSALELTERHCRKPNGVIVLSGCWIGEGRPRIKMNAPHDSADQPLDVTAVAGCANGSPNELNALLPARPRKRPA